MAALLLTPWGRSLDHRTADVYYRFQAPISNPDIVIVGIDEPSMSVFEHQWPWPRHWHARLIDALFSAGARAVVLDILFPEPGRVEEDEQLAAAIDRHSYLLLAAGIEVIQETTFTNRIFIKPHPTLSVEDAEIGLDILPLDPDGLVRRSILAFNHMPSLAWMAAWNVADDGGRQRLEELISEDEPIAIHFLGPPRTIRTVSYYQALQADSHLPRDFFKDKLVFVGLTLKQVPHLQTQRSDYYLVPTTLYYRMGPGQSGLMAGVEIHATIAANLLDNAYLRPLPTAILWPAAILYWLICAWSALHYPWRTTVAILLGSVIIIPVCSYLAFSSWHYRIPILLILLPAMVGQAVAVIPRFYLLRKEKKKIRATFSRYLSPQVVDQVLNQPDSANTHGQQVEGTVLYLDIAEFTSMAEKMKPETVVEMAGYYLGAFTDVITRRNGTVDKIAGDAVMAVWGAPDPCPDHARQACEAAVEIVEQLETLNHRAPPQYNNVDIRIGINSGPMVAGNVGGKYFSNYTVHGDAVNLAVRLETANKSFDTRILIGEETATGLNDIYCLRQLDKICVRGRSNPVRVFELIGKDELVSDAQKAALALFERGRADYENRRWESALRLFQKAYNLNPDDLVTRGYQAQCERFMKHPPHKDWDGVRRI